MHLLFTIVAWYIFALSALVFFMQASRYTYRRSDGKATDEQYWWIYLTIAIVVLSGVAAIRLTFFWSEV